MRSSMRRLCCALAFAAAPLSALAQVDGIPGAAAPDRAAVDADAARRQELAEAMLAAREAESGRPLDAGYRALLKDRLAAAGASRLEAALAGRGGELPELMVPGDAAADLVYTPVAPCRIIDTRSAVAGILGAGTQRNFFVAGSAGFPNQGGTSGGCGVPLGPATAVMVNFAAVAPTGAGNLRAWAVASPQPPAPNAVVMNFNPVLSALANGIAVPICNTSAGSCVSDLRLQADVSSVHVVADVVGYFSRLGGPRSTQVIYAGQTNATPPGIGAPVFMRNLGTFSKSLAGSEIEAVWHGHVRQVGTPGTTFCQFQLRIDDQLPVNTTSDTGAGAVLYAADAPVTLSGRWRGLAAGTQTVSLWLRGTATTCTVNFQNFGSQWVEVVER
jgi:hypothetical protein